MFSQRLQNARKAKGLSLRALGDAVGLSHAAIKKYEDGGAMPSSDVLIKLARALSVRSEYFFRPETLVLEGIEYRKRSSLPKKRLDAITHEVIDQIERRVELENLFPSPPATPFAIAAGLPKQIKALEEIEIVADGMRLAWGLGFDPIPDLVDVLETHGIRVFMVELSASEKFDGLAAVANGMPIVVVGTHWPGDRQRFTLAHELGHLVLEGRLSKELDEEAACNRFAGAFLLPAQSVRQELGEHRNAVEMKELGLLKEEFGLSMAAVLYRARDLGVITPAYRDSLHRLFRIKGWHIAEPGEIYRAEKAHVFEQLVFHALAEDYIGESKAAELMKLPLTDFQRLRAMESMDAAAHQ